MSEVKCGATAWEYSYDDGFSQAEGEISNVAKFRIEWNVMGHNGKSHRRLDINISTNYGNKHDPVEIDRLARTILPVLADKIALLYDKSRKQPGSLSLLKG